MINRFYNQIVNFFVRTKVFTYVFSRVICVILRRSIKRGEYERVQKHNLHLQNGLILMCSIFFALR